MTFRFDETIREGVLAHMNGDHSDDNLLIVRAFGEADATASIMTDLDGEAGVWEADLADGATRRIRVPWPGGAITERPQIRAEIVKLYDAACLRLGVVPRPHA